MSESGIFVALGANLGDAAHTIEEALLALEKHPDLQLLACSSLYQSPPWQADGPDYVNAVASLKTSLSVFDLLSALQTLEQQFGRERLYRNAPRTLDLDLLLYGDVQVQTPALTVPHPRMWERAFVVYPLAEIAPHLVSQAALAAVAGQTIVRLESHSSRLTQ